MRITTVFVLRSHDMFFSTALTFSAQKKNLLSFLIIIKLILFCKINAQLDPYDYIDIKGKLPISKSTRMLSFSLSTKSGSRPTS